LRMDGLELSARFGLPPNSHSYCGKPSFRTAFRNFLSGKTPLTSAALENSLKRFTAHYAYLRLIASAGGFSPFDRRVTEALWLGNGLLSRVDRKKMQGLIADEFSGPGMLSKPRAEKLANGLPEGFVPHHSFHVLYLHTISGVIGPSVKNADSCRVSWGRVIRAGGGFVDVETQKLARKKGKLALVPARKRWKTACAGIALVPSPKAGQWVASHWGVAVMRISSAQKKRLERITRRNISAANSL
jgi:hydrogenase maturation factor